MRKYRYLLAVMQKNRGITQKLCSDTYSDAYKSVIDWLHSFQLVYNICFMLSSGVSNQVSDQYHAVTNADNGVALTANIDIRRVLSQNGSSQGQINSIKDQQSQENRAVDMLKEIIVNIAEVNDDESDDDEDGNQRQIKRVKQSLGWFWLTIIASLITGTENLYIFLGTMPYRDVIFTTPTLLFRIIFFPLATYNLCKNYKVIKRLYFMIDKILMSAILVYIGVLGFILIFLAFTPSQWFYQSLFILFPILWLFYTGHFRVMMVYCQWEKWQVITFKISLLIGAMSYFILGIYYLVNQLRFTRGLSPELDNTIENLLLIFINSGFQCYLQMFSKMDSIDGSSDFKLDYTLHCDPDDMEKLLKGGKQQKSQNGSSTTSSLTSDQSSFTLEMGSNISRQKFNFNYRY